MGLQADIKWIHTEIDKVEDATLLEAIKSMLKYRAKVVQPKPLKNTVIE